MKTFFTLSLALILFGFVSSAPAHDREYRGGRSRLEGRLENASDRYTQILAARHYIGTNRHIEGEVGQIGIDLRNVHYRIRNDDRRSDRAEEEMAHVEDEIAHVEREIRELRGERRYR